MFSQMQVSVFYFYILDTICSIYSTVKQKYSASFVKSKEFSQKCLTNKAKTAILKIFTAMGLLVYHEKGFDGKKRERILHRRESAAGVSRQQGRITGPRAAGGTDGHCPVSVGCAGYSPLAEYTLSDVMSGRTRCVKKSGTTEKNGSSSLLYR